MLNMEKSILDHLGRMREQMPTNYVRIYLYLYLYPTTLVLLLHSRVIDVVESIILERTIEASPVVRSQG